MVALLSGILSGYFQSGKAKAMSKLRESYGKISSQQGILVNRCCAIDGTPTGDCAIKGDYSNNPTEFYIVSPPGMSLEIIQINMSVGDSGNYGITDFGAVSNGLINGLGFFVDVGQGAIPLSASPIKTNFDMLNVATSSETTNLSGSGRVITYRELGFPNASLTITPLQRFGVIAHDNFTNSTAMRVVIKCIIRRHSVA